MATYQRVYAYLFYMLHEKQTAVNLLEETYEKALRQFGSLTRADLFMPWLFRTAFHLCMEKLEIHTEHIVKVGGKGYPLSALLNLPLSQSQILIMRTYQKLSVSETGDLLNFSNAMVKRYVKSAYRHLQRNASGAVREKYTERELFSHRVLKERKLDILTNERIVKEIFASCGRKENNIPLMVD